VVIAAIAYWLAKPVKKKTEAPQIYTLKTGFPTLDAPYPAAKGKFRVRTLFYGSGTDKHRPEYGAKTDLITSSVNASPFVPEGWSVARTFYWGFDQTRLPINGRVWFPDGKGPFPLVLIVHGAGIMTDSSDAGFAYLGELLASRGYIVASLDENFLNYGWHRHGDFEESDIGARAWLILQHLRAWQEWNMNKENPFHEKVDMERIALIGHSRGGEAIAAAAAFNRMGRYPKNSNIVFDFNFGIQTLIALSPSDIYQPQYERTTPAEIRDVNYLLLLGTHDRQVPVILGSRVYQRVRFSENTNVTCSESKPQLCDAKSYIKAALYIHRANHSQFNTVWGIYDFPWPYHIFSNTAAHLSGEEQRLIAQIYVSAFLDSTLQGDKRYIQLFRDYRLIEHWLPKTAYISRFQDSTFRAIANFDEDIDPETATVAGGRIIGKNLSHWHEEDIDYHYYLPYGSRSNRVVSISWDEQKENTPLFGVKLPEKRVRTWKLSPTNMFVFFIACPDQQVPPDLTIELIDSFGKVSQLALRDVFPLQSPLYSRLTKIGFLEVPSPVIVLQTVAIPLSRFLPAKSSLNLAKLSEVNFRFDNRTSGKVLLDDIGFD
jgi:dienelactone hydrolase